MSRECELPGCGLEMVEWVFNSEEDGYPGSFICPRNDDAHELCRKLAESEAKVKELEAKLAEVDAALIGSYHHDGGMSKDFCGSCANAIYEGHEPNCPVPASLSRYEARKKGAEHGE